MYAYARFDYPKSVTAWLVVAAFTILSLPFFAFATGGGGGVDQCNQEFVYVKSTDWNDSRVDINFENSDEQIDVSADTGYEIVKVELDVVSDGHSGYFTYATGPVNNFNPSPGGDIDSAKITVKKVCTEVCNDPAASNYQALTPGETVANNSLCSYPPPPDVCPNIEGIQQEIPDGYHLEDDNCVEDEPEVTDMCPNLEGDQSTVPEGYELDSENQCVPVESTPPTPTADTPPSGGGGNGPPGLISFGDPIIPVGGNLLPETSGATASSIVVELEDCTQYLTENIRFGASNNAEQVLRLQRFLRDLEGFAGVTETGIYDDVSHQAVHDFQRRYADRILTPWGATITTGFVYHTTKKTVNEIYCKFTKEFPLSGDQLAEIERVRTLGLAPTAPNQSAPASTGTGSEVPVTNEAPDIGLVDREDLPAAVGESETGSGVLNSISNFFKEIF